MRDLRIWNETSLAVMAEASLSSGPPPWTGGKKDQSKTHLTVTVTGYLPVIEKHTIDPCGKGNEITA